MLGRELPFPAALVPADDGDGLAASEVLFARDRNDRSTASLELERDGGGGVIVTDHACGRSDLQLIKITGSAFADFARDEYTTLPERRDRPLYIWTDIGWRYADASDALGDRSGALRRRASRSPTWPASVFHQFVSLSIQHLVNEIGLRMLERWPQLAEVSFEATNRLWDPGRRQTRPTSGSRPTPTRGRRTDASAWSCAGERYLASPRRTSSASASRRSRMARWRS